jgi:hypothetical protein
MGAINPLSYPSFQPQFGVDLHEIATVPGIPSLPPESIDIILVPPDTPLTPGLEVPTSPQTNMGQLFGYLVGAITKVRGLLPLIPPFIYQVINSEERHLQNIKVDIVATSKKKIYQIEFGKMDGEGVSIALEVAAGKPIKLMHDRAAANRMDDYINAVFPVTSLFDRIWKRQEPHTECIITVEDPGNHLLRDASITQFISLSEHEGFKIVHRDPTIIRNPFGPDYDAYDYYDEAENSGYTTLNSVSVKLTKPMPPEEKIRSEIFPLPFHDDPKKANDYYLEITQYQ